MHCGTRFPSCSAPAGHAGRPAGVPSRMITQVPAVAGTLPGTIPTRFEGTFRLLVETERLLSQADTTRENNFISSSDNKELPALSATPPLTAYDQRTLRSRSKIIAACSLARSKRAAEGSPQHGPSELILLAQDVPGGMLCLLTAGQHALAAQVGSQLLNSLSKEQKSPQGEKALRDIALSVAWAHACLAVSGASAAGPEGSSTHITASLAKPSKPAGPSPPSSRGPAQQSYQQAKAALDLAVKYDLASALPQLTPRLQKLVAALAPACALEMLLQAAQQTMQGGTASAGAASLRAQAVTLLKEVLWAAPGFPERQELMSRVRPLLTAAELIQLYQAAPTTPGGSASASGSSEEEAGAASASETTPGHSPGKPHMTALEAYDLAAAYLAEGITRRWPPDIARAQQLLHQVSSQADVSLELAVCDLLLGKATAAEAVELGLESGDLTNEDAMVQALESIANTSTSTPVNSSNSKAAAAQKGSSTTGSKASAGSGKAGDSAQEASSALLQAASGGPAATSSSSVDASTAAGPLDSYDWAGEWLELSVLSLFPEKAGQHVDVRAYLSSPSVKLLNQAQGLDQGVRSALGSLADMSAGAVGSLAAGTLSTLSRAGGLIPRLSMTPAGKKTDAKDSTTAAAQPSSTAAKAVPAASATLDTQQPPAADVAAAAYARRPTPDTAKGSTDSHEAGFVTHTAPGGVIVVSSHPLTGDLNAGDDPAPRSPSPPIAIAPVTPVSEGSSSSPGAESDPGSALYVMDAGGHLLPRMSARIVTPAKTAAHDDGLEDALKNDAGSWVSGAVKVAAAAGILAALVVGARNLRGPGLQPSVVAHRRSMEVWEALTSGAAPAAEMLSQQITEAQGLAISSMTSTDGSSPLTEAGAGALLHAWQLLRSAPLSHLGSTTHRQLASQLCKGQELRELVKEAQGISSRALVVQVQDASVKVERVAAQPGSSGDRMTVVAVLSESGQLTALGSGGGSSSSSKGTGAGTASEAVYKQSIGRWGTLDGSGPFSETKRLAFTLEHQASGEWRIVRVEQTL